LAYAIIEIGLIILVACSKCILWRAKLTVHKKLNIFMISLELLMMAAILDLTLLLY